MIDTPWMFFTSLIFSSIWFGIAYFEVLPQSPAILLAFVTFTIATAFAYWLYASQACVETKGKTKSSTDVNQKTPYDEETEKSDEPNWFKKLWSKIKNWMSGKGNHPEEAGIIIVRQTPKLEYLASDSELGFTPDTVKRNESPSEGAQRSVTEKTALKSKDLNFVPNFSKNAVIESTDPKGNTQTKLVNYQLAEISPERKVTQDNKWLTPSEAMEQFPEMVPVISACNRELNDPMNESNYDMMPRSTRVNDAPLGHWYRDPEDRKLIWRVLNRDSKTVAIGAYGHPNKKNPCFKSMVITAIISIISTLLVVGAVAALLHFFPDIFKQLWDKIVQVVTGAIDMIKTLFGK